MEKLCWSLIEPHLVLHGLEEIACLDDSHPFFLRSSFESSVWRYFHALSSTVLACLESILLLALLMRWPNQKAAVQKQKITSKVQLPCFELFHDSYCSGFSRDYLDYLTLRLFDWPFMLYFSTSNVRLGDLLDLGKVVEAPTRQGARVDETGGPDIGTDVNNDVHPACHCWKCLEQPSHFTFYSSFYSCLLLTKMFLKFLINVTAVERALVTMSETSAIQRLKGVGVSKEHRSPKLQRLDRQIN